MVALDQQHGSIVPSLFPLPDTANPIAIPQDGVDPAGRGGQASAIGPDAHG